MMEPEDGELFAGPGGWGVAELLLGIRTKGLEWDAAAVATATAAGLIRLVDAEGKGLDVAASDPLTIFPNGLRLLVGSPPCQAFSPAGKGLGRKLAHFILMGVQLIAWGNDPTQVCKWVDEQMHDDRAALVLEPLRWAVALRPETIVLEQVATVLPLWEAIGEVLRGLGYSVWTGNLTAEQYDVPQTRKRAILIASRIREAGCPPPVRRKYRKDRKTGETNRLRPFPLDNPALKPWISMADAIGYGMTERPCITVTAGAGRQGGPDPLDGGSGARKTLQQARDRGEWLRSNHGHHQRPRDPETGKLIVRDGTRDWYYRTSIDNPAPTVSSGMDGAAWDSAIPDPDGISYWTAERPATTVQGDPRIWPPGHKVNADDRRRMGAEADQRYGDRKGSDAIRVTVQEAAVLQGFPADYPWQGTKGAQHRQVGDAVPPPLAWHILRAALGLPVQHYPGTEEL